MKMPKNRKQNKRGLEDRLVNRGLVFVALMMLFVTTIASVGVASATVYVPDDYAKIQWAVDNATVGDTIIVRDGTYEENVNINKCLTIRSENGSSACIVQAVNINNDVFYVTKDASIIGLTIRGSDRYGIYALYSDLYTEDVIIKDNINYGIHFYYGKEFTLKNSTIEDNGGGVAASDYATGDAIVENNIIRNNAGWGLNIQLAQLKHATITNNLIDTNSGRGLQCYITGVGGGATIRDNVISNSGSYGAVIHGVKDTTITNMTFDGAGDDGLYLAYCSNVTIKEPFTIQNADRYGIYALYSDLYAEDVIIKDNINYGIHFYYGKEFTLKNCTIEDNGGGVAASGYASGDAVAENNIIRNNAGHGLNIQLAQLKHATITNNLIDTNSGIGLQCYITGVGGGATIKDNAIRNSGSHGLHIYGVKDTTITNMTIDGAIHDGLCLQYCSNVTIKEPFTIQNADRYGIYALYSDIHAKDITIKNNDNYGIHFYYGKEFTLKNCTIEDNGGGVTASGYASGDAVAENNVIRNNAGYGLVIQLAQLKHATITDNLIDTNSREGIYCYMTGVGGGATIEGNVINNSGSHGAYVYGVNDALITMNTISNSYNYGVYLHSSSGNAIYLNNLNNIQNIYSSNSNNIWNSTEPITYQYNGSTYTNYTGNYWGDYTGNDADGDGIGDAPHPIPPSDADSFPLMHPWPWTATPPKGDLNGDGRLTSADAAIALRIAASGGWDLDADVSGDGSVTSLDALMILQAAAGAIDL